MTTWEYKTVKTTLKADMWTGEAKITEAAMNLLLLEIGLEGWELVSTTHLTGYEGQASQLLMIFKRPKSV
jgi:hypothetical protein